jgi:class 3 adenylate cyclase
MRWGVVNRPSGNGDLLAAYLPEDRRYALAQGHELADRSQGAVLFADISGFTPLG